MVFSSSNNGLSLGCMAANGSRIAAVIEKELKAKRIQMKKELQELISQMKDDVSRANNIIDLSSMVHIQPTAELMGIVKALEKYIPMLTLLLNSESENSGKNDADNSDKPM